MQLGAQLVGVVGAGTPGACARRRRRRPRRRRAWPGPGSSRAASAYSTAVPSEQATIPSDEAIDDAATGDVWLFRGHSHRRPGDPHVHQRPGQPRGDGRRPRRPAAAAVAHRAGPVRSRTCGPATHHRGAQLNRLDDAYRVWTGQVRPAGVRPPVPRRGHAGDGGRAAAGHRDVRRQAVPEDRAGWPAGGSRAASARRRPARPCTAPSCWRSRSAGWACSTPSSPSNWYDPGKFWSGDRLELADGASLGGELARRRLICSRADHSRIGATSSGRGRNSPAPSRRSVGTPRSGRRARSAADRAASSRSGRRRMAAVICSPSSAHTWHVLRLAAQRHARAARASSSARDAMNDVPSRRASAAYIDHVHCVATGPIASSSAVVCVQPRGPPNSSRTLCVKPAGDRQPDEALVVRRRCRARRVRVGLEHDLGGLDDHRREGRP